MKVGDLVTMPGQKLREGESAPVAVVLKTGPEWGARAGHLARVKVYWIQDEENAWEPREWLEVISASR